MSVHPENILADEVTPSTMTLSWQDSMHSNLVGEDDDWRSRLIQGYQIFAISEEEDEEEELVHETKGAEDGCTVEGLHQDTSYRFAIKMICAHDIEVERSEWSHPFRTKREERRALRIKDCAAKVPDHCSANIFHLSRKAVPLSGSGIQKYEIGASSPKDIGKKVLLMVGGTGTGKTTLINSMANYLYEVRPEDPFRFKLISEQDELKECGTHDATKSQTKLVGAYVLNDTRLNYQLTVVDTPGFGDTEGGSQFDHQTVAYIKSWFSQRGAAGISQIDGICIVVKSTDVAINAHVRHELTSIVELFGKHMEQNILIMFTFSDTAKPPAIYALKNAGIPIDRAFKFNNSAVFEQYIDASDDLSGDEHDNASLRKIFWDMGMRSFHEFFKQLDNVPSGSLCMSLETLKTREMLEQQTLRLSERIKEELERAKNISETIEMLVNNKSAIDCNRDFAIKLKQYRAEKRPVGDSERCALTCLNCNFSCLKQCSRAEGLEIQWSVIMRRSMELMSEQSLPESSASNAAHAPNEEQIRVQKESATCAVCPAKCHWSAHAICDYVIEYEEVVVEEKIADLMERYQVDPESGEKTITQMLAEKMARAFVEKEQEMRHIVAEIRVRLNQLNEIDMTPEQSTTDLAYFLMLLEGEKADMLPGYHKRIAILERQLSLLQPRHSLSDDADSTAIQYLNDKYPQLYELTVSNEQDVPATNAIARLHARNKGDDSDDDNPASAEKLSPMKMHLKFWRDMGL
uniref:Fibronectin type-III domain-containing protein n=1 Tax=Plectus sambesii TaxID=2011161 RepID=A0A914W1L6_9BILA